MLKLKLQYFGHLMRSVDSLEKTLMLGKVEGRRRRGQQSWIAQLVKSMTAMQETPVQFLGQEFPLEMVKDREACCAIVHGVAKSRTRLSN